MRGGLNSARNGGMTGPLTIRLCTDSRARSVDVPARQEPKIHNPLTKKVAPLVTFLPLNRAQKPEGLRSALRLRARLCENRSKIWLCADRLRSCPREFQSSDTALVPARERSDTRPQEDDGVSAATRAREPPVKKEPDPLGIGLGVCFCAGHGYEQRDRRRGTEASHAAGG